MSSIVNQPHVVILGKPSAALAEKLEKDEKARVAAQKERLGEEGLAAAERALEAAKKEHDKEIPKDVLASFPVPDVNSISWIPVQSLQEPGKGEGRRRLVEQSGNAELARHIQNDGQELPFFVQYDHVHVCPFPSGDPICLSCTDVLMWTTCVSPTSFRSTHTFRWRTCLIDFVLT